MRRLVFEILGSIVLIVTTIWLTLYLEKAGEFGVPIIVVNDSNDEIWNVVVEYQGGACSIHSIPGKSKRTTLANVAGASSVRVRYADGHGKNCYVPVDVYFEPYYQGHVTVHIAQDGSIKTENTTRPF